MLLFRQFGDANPNSIEASYYERTINATYMYGADHIRWRSSYLFTFLWYIKCSSNKFTYVKVFFISFYFKEFVYQKFSILT